MFSIIVKTTTNNIFRKVSVDMKEIRRERIKALIEEKGNVTIDELKKHFNVSEMTIYRDLKILQSEGVLEQIRGGAILSEREVNYSYEFNLEQRLFNIQKQAIAKEALSLLKPGMSVVLDNSSTAFEIAKLLKNYKRLTVFTTSRETLNVLSSNADIDVYCCGGLYSRKTDAFIGRVSESFLDSIHASIGFIGASGLTVKEGLTDPLPSEASMKRKIIKCSKKVVVLADSSKIGVVSMEKVEQLENLDYLITDRELAKKDLAELKKYLTVLICKM